VTPTIVVAGVVHHLEGLQGLGQIQRARWGVLAPYAARWPADLVVVGRSSGGVDPVAVIAGLKDGEATAGIPVLHVVPDEGGCAECRADVCLSDVPVAGQLARVAKVLIELGEARGGTGRPPRPGPDLSGRSERLEGLGRLAGGIVHEFNNLLFVITGQIELARRKLTPDHAAFARLTPALDAAVRAAALNRQLQAFCRSAPPDPRPTDLNALLERLDPILRRVIGRDLRVEIHAGQGLGRVWADVTEMEQLVLNLVLDARDARPGGGLLTVETRDVEMGGGAEASLPPGRYVMVAVSGEGVGLDAEPLPGSAESGFALVRRIVERHGGRLRVDIAPGRGTTFRVYLPCLDESAEA
jgi:signal transduction histidine kinase